MIRLGIGGAIAATVTAATLAVPGEVEEARAAAPTPPNVIVIMTDDMRVDDLAEMPKTRRLLAGTNGANYTKAHVTTPLCCPSRATFLTGQYAHNNGVYDNAGPNGSVDSLDDTSTLPVWLQSAGYRTVMFGKYLNGYGLPSDGTAATYVPPGWDHWAALSHRTMSNYTDFDITVGSSTPDASSTGAIEHVANGYQTWNFTGRAVSRIRASVPLDQPMFMWLSLFAPHPGAGDFPHQSVPAEPKYQGTSTVGLPTSPAVDEARIADKPPWIKALPRLTDRDKARIVTHRRERRNALRSVDDSVSRVVDALRDAGELDNTVIIFTSDNGLMLGEHRITHWKTVPYLEAARVPLLIRGPGFTSGTRTEPVSNVDLAPTVADVSGVTPTLPVDGISLLGPIGANRPILLEYLGDPVPIGMPAYGSVIQGRWQYSTYETSQELYDLADDPWQLQNRIGDPSTVDVRQRLAVILAELRDCAGQSCR